MAIRKRSTDDAPKAVKPKKITPAAKASSESAGAVASEASGAGIGSGVVVSRSFTIPGSGNFESMKVGVSVGRATYEEASEEVDRYISEEVEKAGQQFRELLDAAEDTENDIGSDDDDTDTDAAEEGDADGEDGELSPEDIDDYDRDQLAELIEENELEIDPEDDEYEGNRGLRKLRKAIVEELFADEDGDGETEEGDGEDTDENGEDGEDITEADIRAMKRSELVEFIDENEVDVDHTDAAYKKLEKLQDAVIDALNEEDDGEGEDGEAEEGEEDGESEEDGEGYTRDELEKLSVAELKEIWDTWKIKGKFPTGSVIVKKKAAITKILDVQENGV